MVTRRAAWLLVFGRFLQFKTEVAEHVAGCALAALDGAEFDATDPKEVARRASTGECGFCREALERFSSLLGAAAGDLALLFCATAGVYIGGGLCKRLGGMFDAARFCAAFVAKGRFEEYLSAIPVYLVTRRDPGLLGAACYPLPG